MAAFPTGTKIFFKQTAAPTGWTKETTNDDYTLRVVSGATGGAFTGTQGFTTCMTFRTLNATIDSVDGSTDYSIADTPAHNHTIQYSYYATGAASKQANNSTTPLISSGGSVGPSGNNGGSGWHNHTVSASGTFTGSSVDFRVKYVDFILATKA